VQIRRRHPRIHLRRQGHFHHHFVRRHHPLRHHAHRRSRRRLRQFIRHQLHPRSVRVRPRHPRRLQFHHRHRSLLQTPLRPRLPKRRASTPNACLSKLSMERKTFATARMRLLWASAGSGKDLATKFRHLHDAEHSRRATHQPLHRPRSLPVLHRLATSSPRSPMPRLSARLTKRTQQRRASVSCPPRTALRAATGACPKPTSLQRATNGSTAQAGPKEYRWMASRLSFQDTRHRCRRRTSAVHTAGGIRVSAMSTTCLSTNSARERSATQTTARAIAAPLPSTSPLLEAFTGVVWPSVRRNVSRTNRNASGSAQQPQLKDRR
jgi:hypothetical protein